MKTIVDQNAVNTKLDELRRVAKTLGEYAGPVYSITGTDASFDQIMRIHRAKDHFKTIAEARLVLFEVGETRGKKLTISDEQKKNFQRIAAHVRHKIYPSKYITADAFVINKGVVSVDEKAVRKLLEAEHTINVSDEDDTVNWITSLTALVNQAPDKTLKNRLGRFLLLQNESLKGIKITVIGDELRVIDL